jgi:hypothetical protein
LIEVPIGVLLSLRRVETHLRGVQTISGVEIDESAPPRLPTRVLDLETSEDLIVVEGYGSYRL